MAPSQPAAAISAEGVVIARRRRSVLIVDHLRIAPGTITTLVGPNGSGKTTLLHAVAGLLAVQSGELRVLGEPPAAVRRRVAYVLQTTAVAEQLPLTVREVVAMGRYGALGLVRRFGTDDRAAVDAALRALELTDVAGRQLSELSGGQRQRALVAQGVAQDADVLLLDEPLTGLDLASGERIRSVVNGARAAGRTVVVATHDLAEAARADSVVLLAGRVVAAGVPDRILTRTNLAEAYGGRLLQVEGDVVMVDDGAHHDHV